MNSLIRSNFGFLDVTQVWNGLVPCLICLLLVSKSDEVVSYPPFSSFLCVGDNSIFWITLCGQTNVVSILTVVEVDFVTVKRDLFSSSTSICVCLYVWLYLCLSVCVWRLLGGSWNISVSWSGRDSDETNWCLRHRENRVKWTDYDLR